MDTLWANSEVCSCNTCILIYHVTVLNQSRDIWRRGTSGVAETPEQQQPDMSKLKAIYLSCSPSSGYSGLETFALNICSNKEPSSSTIMWFTRRNVALCLLIVLTAASLASVVQTTDCTISPDDNRCPAGWYPYDGACYGFFNNTFNFQDAEDHCITLGAHLVSIHSEEEKAKAICLIPDSGWVRISLETRSVLS